MIIATLYSNFAGGSAIQLHLAAEKEFSLNEPINADLVFANTSSSPIYFETNLEGTWNTKVRIVTPAGSKLLFSYDDIDRDCIDCVDVLAPSPLGARDTHRVRVVLNKWHTFSELGEYDVRMLLNRAALEDISADPTKVSFGEDGVPHIRLTDDDEEWLNQPVESSNPIRFVITPRDERRLAQRCKDMVSVVLATGDPQDAFPLGYTKDPIAIPYLERLMNTNRRVRRIAIEGLGRIASLEAVDALGRVIGAHESYVDIWIAQTLNGIARRTVEEDVRLEVLRVSRNHADDFDKAFAQLVRSNE